MSVLLCRINIYLRKVAEGSPTRTNPKYIYFVIYAVYLYTVIRHPRYLPYASPAHFIMTHTHTPARPYPAQPNPTTTQALTQTFTTGHRRAVSGGRDRGRGTLAACKTEAMPPPSPHQRTSIAPAGPMSFPRRPSRSRLETCRGSCCRLPSPLAAPPPPCCRRPAKRGIAPSRKPTAKIFKNMCECVWRGGGAQLVFDSHMSLSPRSISPLGHRSCRKLLRWPAAWCTKHVTVDEAVQEG